MKPEIKIDEKPIVTSVIPENSPEEVRNIPGPISASSVVISKNNQTPLSRGIKLIILVILTAMAVWLAFWIGTKIMTRRSWMFTKVRTPLVLNAEVCGWVEYNEDSQAMAFMVNTTKFKGVIVDCHSKHLEVIIPTDRNAKVCYVLPMRSSHTFKENNSRGVVPYLQERGFHKFVVRGEILNDLDLCEVSRKLCRGLKLMLIQPIAGRDKKSLLLASDKRDDDDDDDVIKIFIL